MEFNAAITFTACLRILAMERLGFAAADGGQPIRITIQVDQVVTHGPARRYENR